MSKFPVHVLLLGGVGCGKSKFIQKLSDHYALKSYKRLNGFEIYISDSTDYVLFLCNINNAEKLKDIDRADVVILSHSSDDPHTFRSLQKRWIPRLAKLDVEHLLLMDNASIQPGILSENQFISVSTELGRKLAEGSSLLWCTAYSSEYKEAFAILKNVLKEPMPSPWPSGEGIPDAISANQYNSNECTTNELNSTECSTVVFGPNEFSVLGECTPDNCSPVGQDSWFNDISSPHAEFSSGDFSSDENINRLQIS